jgi:hypothetical protein
MEPAASVNSGIFLEFAIVWVGSVECATRLNRNKGGRKVASYLSARVFSLPRVPSLRLLFSRGASSVQYLW